MAATASLSAQLAPTPAAYMAHGISHELAGWRSRTISDVRYDLLLDVSPLDSAIGRVTVHFVRTGTGDVILDYRGRRLNSASANGILLLAPAFDGNHLRVPARFLHIGQNAIEVSFVSEIAPTGASIIRVHDPADQSDYLYTLLVPADANQLFPCFDQPDLKARVTLSLTTPIAWTSRSRGVQ